MTDCTVTHSGNKGAPQLNYSKTPIKKSLIHHVHAAAYSPLQVYKLKAMQETKMENIAAVKRLAVQKAYFYLCHATQVTTNIFCCLSPLLVEKKAVDHSHSVTLVNYSWKS